MYKALMTRRNKNNSLGTGWEVAVFTEAGDLPSRFYYGYTEREAVRKYREEFHLQGLHFVKYKW